MAKLYRTSGTGNAQQTLDVNDEKIKIYADETSLDTDLANIGENEIVATNEEDSQRVWNPVDVVQDGNMNAVTSNAVADAISYSTTEQKTGGTWIDGKPIYRKIIAGNITSTIQQIDHQIADIENYVQVIPYMTASGQLYPSFNTGSYYFTMFAASTTRLTLQCVQAYVDYGYRVILEYTKTTD